MDARVDVVKAVTTLHYMRLLGDELELSEPGAGPCTSAEHPEHIRGSGPEQDYLSRYFASAPWHHLDLRWNFQVHHMPFALELLLSWRRVLLERAEQGRWVLPEDYNWCPPRLQTDLDTIGIIHFSGDVKPWHMVLDAVQDNNQRRAVEHAVSSWHDEEVDAFGDYLLRRCCESYTHHIISYHIVGRQV